MQWDNVTLAVPLHHRLPGVHPPRLRRGRMTEADARALLHDCSGFGGLEAWLGGRLLRQGRLARAARVIA
jgi:hypothetical protein